jgi:hypothetical protein
MGRPRADDARSLDALDAFAKEVAEMASRAKP